MREIFSEADGNDRTIMIAKTLRSGQTVVYDGNVVVLGDLNPGAEIIARGHVLVMGSLRGFVHAGSSGMRDATVTALDMNPTQIRICDYVTRPPDNEYVKSENIAETARIKDGGIVIEAYRYGANRLPSQT